MSGKLTSLAAQLKRDDEAEKLAQAREDKEVSQRPTEDGKVWVRLVRPHYNSEGFLLLPGVCQVDVGAIPSSAKVLTQAQADAKSSKVESDDPDATE